MQETPTTNIHEVHPSVHIRAGLFSVVGQMTSQALHLYTTTKICSTPQRAGKPLQMKVQPLLDRDNNAIRMGPSLILLTKFN